MLDKMKTDFRRLGRPAKGKILGRFFKTGPGEYGAGDVFLGISVPEQRRLAKLYQTLVLTDVAKLLRSKIHEHRQTALLILVGKYKSASELEKKKIFDLYLANTRYINNWDLVDLSAPSIVGDYLLDKDRKVLYKLARSRDLWQKRIAMLACFKFIRNNDFKDALKISEILLNDGHDLIHKAVGWMLREIGKRDLSVEEKFLKRHYKKMPRTMLRYAIEKFPETKRKMYLRK